MSFIDAFLNQRVTHERYLGRAGGAPRYAAAQEIPARFEPRLGRRYTETGTELQAESYVLTAAEVKVEDRINGKTVRRVVPIVDLDGSLAGYEAYL